jgi:D-xylose transport system ATP-binding protein
VQGLTAARVRGAAPFLRDITFEIRAGEVVGIGGLMGAGRTELLMRLIGAWGAAQAGCLEVKGHPYRRRSPRDALRRGLALVSEDRKRYGLVLQRGVAQFVAVLAARVMQGRSWTQRASSPRPVDRERPAYQEPTLDAPATTLSGGNQQKVVIGKMLLTTPQVLLLDSHARHRRWRQARGVRAHQPPHA